MPACKYCNSHKSSRSVEEFRQWVRARIFDNSVPFNNQVLGRWKINNGRVVFYFELAEVRQQGQSLGDGDRAECKPQDAGRSQRQPRSSPKGSSLSPEFVGKFGSSNATDRKLLVKPKILASGEQAAGSRFERGNAWR